MDLFSIDYAAIMSFVLTLMRISLVLFMLPIFSVEGLPPQWKAAMCLILTFSIWPTVQLPMTTVPEHALVLVLLLLGELVLGLILGLCTRFFFFGIQGGGDLMSMQVGFSMLQFADPVNGGQTSIIAHMLYLVSTLIFLAMDGHLYLLRAFAETFKYIPAGGLFIGETLVNQVFNLAGLLFSMAIKIIAPVMVALFLVELALGLMSRAAPQVHIMEVGFPIKIAVGFIFVSLIFTLLSEDIRRFIFGLDDMFLNLLRSASPYYN